MPAEMHAAGVLGRFATLAKVDACEVLANSLAPDTLRALKPGESVLIERTDDPAQPFTVTSRRHE